VLGGAGNHINQREGARKKEKMAKVILDRMDLEPDFQDIPYSKTKFEHFNEQARALIVTAGCAQFREYDDSNHNTIYPPFKHEFGKRQSVPRGPERIFLPVLWAGLAER